MKPYKKEFIKFVLQNGVLKFGEFKLKSLRLSPYFFNAGMFKDGEAFHKLSMFYADTIKENFDNNYDVIFGPAYKGIALATIASIGLKVKHNINVPVSFNRKEAKDHGEGGDIIGESLKDKRILLIDDVITAGTTVKESVEIINKYGGKLIGVVIALDRQEIGLTSKSSAIQEAQQNFQLTVANIITRDDLIEYLQETIKEDKSMEVHLKNLLAYRDQYGTKEPVATN